jgi:hypothetical protein
MAQCFFLLKQFEDVNIYLKSIAPYLQGDDKFNYNFGISQAANDNFRGAEASFDAVRSDAIRSEFSYIAWRAKTKIHCGMIATVAPLLDLPHRAVHRCRDSITVHCGARRTDGFACRRAPEHAAAEGEGAEQASRSWRGRPICRSTPRPSRTLCCR